MDSTLPKNIAYSESLFKISENVDEELCMEAVVHLIDDDEAFRKALSRMLRAAGYKVQTYSSAGDFLLSYRDDDLACVLLDVRMPGPSGLDLQASLAARGKTVPIIFLTGHGSIPKIGRASCRERV